MKVKQIRFKVFSILLVVILLVSTLPVAVNAYSYDVNFGTSGDFNYEILDDGTASIITYLGNDGIVNIPEEIDGYTVTRLDSFCTDCSYTHIPDICNRIKKVFIPKTISCIEESYGGAFGIFNEEYFSKLEYIEVDKDNSNYFSNNGILFNKQMTRLIKYPDCKEGLIYNIPETVCQINSYAFSGCNNLTNVIIPESVEKFNHSAFFGCNSLKEVNLPVNLHTISVQMFKKCTSLTNINIPDSVVEIEQCAFEGCTSLTEIEIPENVCEIGFDVFSKCSNLREAKINCKNLKVISSGLFAGCTSLEKVNIPDTVEIIEGHAAGERRYQGAFESCISLNEITLPENFYKCYGWNAFKGCDNLNTIKILNKNKSDIDFNPPWKKCLYGSGIDVINGDWGEGEKKENLVIYGYKNSDAEDFANDRGITFIALDDEPQYIYGDVNLDGEISVTDATAIQKLIIGLYVPEEQTELVNTLADVNNDGVVSILDATCIQKYLVGYNDANRTGELLEEQTAE